MCSLHWKFITTFWNISFNNFHFHYFALFSAIKLTLTIELKDKKLHTCGQIFPWLNWIKMSKLSSFNAILSACRSGRLIFHAVNDNEHQMTRMKFIIGTIDHKFARFITLDSILVLLMIYNPKRFSSSKLTLTADLKKYF